MTIQMKAIRRMVLVRLILAPQLQKPQKDGERRYVLCTSFQELV